MKLTLSRIVVALVIVLVSARAVAAGPLDSGDALSQQGAIRLSSKVSISQFQFVGGGLLGTLVGFGLGHAVQNRWTRTGWIFTLGETVGMGLFAGGFLHDSENPDSKVGIGLIVSGAILMGVLRIAEIVDIWRLPREMEIARLSPAERSRLNTKPRLAVAPIIAPSTYGLAFGVRY
ncbi:MAG: hypothetical protein KC609_00980 [Myxococcales bacterium]|nr:hypothetical protein [Myxococcales bacterium]